MPDISCHSEQERVFGLVPALAHAQYVRYGRMHRNVFLRGPAVLSRDLQLAAIPGVWIAGQLAGVDGYMESTVLGLVAALNVAAALLGVERPDFSSDTMTGLLIDYVTTEREDFQPANANYGLVATEHTEKQRRMDRERFAATALQRVHSIAEEVRTWAKTSGTPM